MNGRLYKCMCALNIVGIVAHSVSGQVVWTGANPTNNHWSQDASLGGISNWNRPLAPVAGDEVIIGAPAPAELDIGGHVATLQVSADGALNLLAGRALRISGGQWTNDGSIHVNSDLGSAQATIELLADTLLDGRGTLTLRSTDFAALSAVGGKILTQADEHTILGEGALLGAVVNNGSIVAQDADGNGAGTLAFLDGGKVNNGRIEATAAGRVLFAGVSVSQGPAGLILADGGVVSLAGTVTMEGGALDTANGGIIQTESVLSTFRDLTNLGTYHLLSGQSAAFAGSSITNHGEIRLNANGGDNASILAIQDNVVLDGSGSIVLARGDAVRILSQELATLTHGPAHTIRGEGRILAALVNEGTIVAEEASGSDGARLLLGGEDKMNSGLITTQGQATLAIERVSVEQTGGGRIDAAAGTIVLSEGARIAGGQLAGTGMGRVEVHGGAALRDVVNRATLEILGGNVLTLTGTSFENHGQVVVNRDGAAQNTRIEVPLDLELTGTGGIMLNQSDRAASIVTAPEATITQAAAHSIRGAGDIAAALVNNGVVEATVRTGTAGHVLELRGDPKVNNHMFQATDGAVLRILGAVSQNAEKGRILALDGGTVELASSAAITGGRLETAGSGRVLVAADVLLTNVTNHGQVDTLGGSILSIDQSLTNDGVITLNSDAADNSARLRFSSTMAVEGAGALVLNHEQHARLQSAPGVTVTNGPVHTIRGAGQISLNLVNRGQVVAAIAEVGDTLMLEQGSIVNEGTIQAAPGANLVVTAADIVQSPIASLAAQDGGAVMLRHATRISGGSLETAGSGVISQANGIVTWHDVRNLGNYRVLAPGALHIDGNVLLNDGTISVNDAANDSNAAITFEQDITLQGTGTISLHHPELALLPTAEGVIVTQASGHTIRGVGRIEGDFVNEGRVEGDSADELLVIGGTLTGGGTLSNVRIDGRHSPGVGPQAVTVEGVYRFENSGELFVELQGHTPGTEYDQVGATGVVHLDGEVVVSLSTPAGFFRPHDGVSFEILHSAQPMSGRFDLARLHSTAVSAQVELVHEADRVLLQIRDPFLSGDFNDNGSVEQSDLDLVLLNWGAVADAVPDTWVRNLPGLAVDQVELDLVLLNWGNCFVDSQSQLSGAIAGTASVPEPGTAVLLVGMFIPLFLRCPFFRKARRFREFPRESNELVTIGAKC